MSHTAHHEPIVWNGIVFEQLDPPQKYQVNPFPIILEAKEYCEAGDVTRTLDAVERGLTVEALSIVDLYPVFLLACRTGPAALVSELLVRGFEPTLLAAREAINGKNVEILGLLKYKGWDHLGQSTKETVPGPLYLAVSKEDADRDVVQWFLDNGADPDRRCLIDKTALSYAVSHAPLDIIELLIEHVHRPQHGELLHSVAFRPTSMGDHAALIELLLRRTPFGVNSLIYGGDVYSRALIAYTGAGTPLHFAALNDRPEVASALINAGANPAILDDKGDCPIDIARRQNYGAVIEVLLRAENQERI